MLRALKTQLIHLSEDPRDQFSAKISARLGEGAHENETKSLKNFILLLPDMIAQIRMWADDNKVPMEIKRLHGFVLTYLYHPLDLLPEETFGLLGYLDDAYLVGDVYHRTMMYAKSSLADNVMDGEFSSKISGWLNLSRKVLPKETAVIDNLLDELLNGNDNAFHELVARTENR